MLPLGDVRTGPAEGRDRLASFEHDSRTFWHAPGDPPVRRPTPRAHLLQILDEIYRDYQDSRMVLDSRGVVPRGRETAIGMALVDGQIVARMRRTLGRSAVFELAPYAAPPRRSDVAAPERAAARYGEFLGLRHELRVVGRAARSASGRNGIRVSTVTWSPTGSACGARTAALSRSR